MNEREEKEENSKRKTKEYLDRQLDRGRRRLQKPTVLRVIDISARDINRSRE